MEDIEYDMQVSFREVIIFLNEWKPELTSIYDAQRYRYYILTINDALAALSTKFKREQTMLRPVFPPAHQLHDTIVWDTETSQYYNKKTDIYLSDDDVAFHKLPKRFDPLRMKLDSDLAEVMEKRFPEMKEEKTEEFWNDTLS